mmetsp:Transcript_10832/g.36119  ORF Transcript_10832/g.36119 Transcript_10832/m.36119 type:complete len:217 (+) Transcript_10832:449-1099(+)
MCSGFAFFSMGSTNAAGSGSFSARTTPRRTVFTSESSPRARSLRGSLYTTPGESMRLMRRVRATYCQIFVSPGIGAALQTAFARSALMTLDLPTLGKPTTPTEICCASLCSTAYCRSTLISAPLPYALVTEARKASVGAVLPRTRIQRRRTQFGTKSTLFSTKIKCLCDARVFMCSTSRVHVVPCGSRASRTWMTTSEQSSTLYSSPQMRRDWPLV